MNILVIKLIKFNNYHKTYLNKLKWSINDRSYIKDSDLLEGYLNETWEIIIKLLVKYDCLIDKYDYFMIKSKNFSSKNAEEIVSFANENKLFKKTRFFNKNKYLLNLFNQKYFIK